MATTADYLTQLQADKQTLVDNLVAKGVEATSDETFTTLAPKVADIPSGGSGALIEDASYLFYYGARINEMDNIISLISPNCTNFNHMFSQNMELTEIPDLSTSNGTNFDHMFYYCRSLTKLPKIDTSNGTNLSHMFYLCEKITEIPVLNTSNGTNFSNMFYGCYKIQEFPEIDITNATTITGMFQQCTGLNVMPKINLNEKITSLQYLFAHCGKMTEYDFSGWNTSNITDMAHMFRNNYALKSIDLSGLDTSNVTTIYCLFIMCNNLKNANLGFDGGKIKNIASAFSVDYGGKTASIVNLIFPRDVGKGYTQKTNNYGDYKINLAENQLLTYESCMSVINNVYDLNLTYDVANGGTLYTQSIVFATDCQSLLSDEEIAVAVNKGWNVSFA